MDISNSYTIKNTAEIPEILLYGYIGNWLETDSKQFISDFKKLESSHDKINVRINSAGGNVFDGLTIYNTLKNSKAEINIFIDGVAASMASVIALAGSKIYMSRYAQLMVHRVSGSANGDADKLRETASLMDDLQSSLLDIYATKTGLEKDTIQNTWMQRGKDTWFNATDAVQQKLVDEIFDGVIKKQPSKNKNPKEIWQFYNLQIENSLNYNQMEILSQFISFFKLNENASAQDILAAMQSQANQNRDLSAEVQKLKQEIGEFQNQLEESHKQKIKDLVEGAIKSNRIPEEQRATFVALAEGNYEATKVALNAITPYRSIASQLQTTSEETPEYKTFREYQEKAPKVLAEMKEKDFTKYNSLFKQQYGKNAKALTN
ncbi:MAG: head maturation protease, ClpP-related [Bacteroidota bacterium]